MDTGLGQRIVLITGAMAAGKSTVAQALAERMNPSVHLRGDIFRRMVVNGRAEMTSNPDEEALRQLMLRYQAAAETAKLYCNAGFDVIYQDVVIGPMLKEVVAMYVDFPLHVIVLCPNASVITHREKTRSKIGYGRVTVQQLQQAMHDTPRLGLWIDSSEQSVEETAQQILDNLGRARIAS
jgi:chloramphenicol 3-O-phosphotransferase